jgi:hypothetical protein
MPADNAYREFRAAQTKVWHGVLLAAVLAAIGLAVMTIGASSIPNAGPIGAVILVLAAAVLAVGLRGALDRQARLVLDGSGVWYRGWGIGTVPWREIAHASLGGAGMKNYLGIELRDTMGFLAGLTASEQEHLHRNHLVRLPVLLVPKGVLDASLDEILAAVESGIEASRHLGAPR